MKKRIVVLMGVVSVGCLLCALIPKEEIVVDGLVQSNSYLIMEKKVDPVILECTPEENAWMLPASETYVPVMGIPKNEEMAQLDKYAISTLKSGIEEAISKYNPGLWYRLDSAYVDSIAESVGNPEKYRIVVNINTDNTIERLEFDVQPDTKPELIRYSQIRLDN